MRDIDGEIKETKKRQTLLSRSNRPDADEVQSLVRRLHELEESKVLLRSQIPAQWAQANERYTGLAKAEKLARRQYRRNVDESYQALAELRTMLAQAGELEALSPMLRTLDPLLSGAPASEAMAALKQAERAFGDLDGASHIRTKLAKARRALKGDAPKRDEAAARLSEALTLLAAESAWRESAASTLLFELNAYDALIRESIGVRLQDRLNSEQADAVASCQAMHRDVSLNF